MKDLKDALLNENAKFNHVFHDEKMSEFSDKLKAAGYSDNIVRMFKFYGSQYVTPEFIAKLLLELKK